MPHTGLFWESLARCWFIQRPPSYSDFWLNILHHCSRHKALTCLVYHWRLTSLCVSYEHQGVQLALVWDAKGLNALGMRTGWCNGWNHLYETRSWSLMFKPTVSNISWDNSDITDTTHPSMSTTVSLEVVVLGKHTCTPAAISTTPHLALCCVLCKEFQEPGEFLPLPQTQRLHRRRSQHLTLNYRNNFVFECRQH